MRSGLLEGVDLSNVAEEIDLEEILAEYGKRGHLKDLPEAESDEVWVNEGYRLKPVHAREEKAAHYARIQELAKAFEEKNGSIVCRELLGLSVKREEPTPKERTAEYYKKRPCKELVGDAAEILEKYIAEHPGDERLEKRGTVR